MIGERFITNEGYELEVIELAKTDSNYRKYFKVKFIDGGYETIVRGDIIKAGGIKNKLAKNIFGVGSLGYADSRKDVKKYKLWYNMLSRCYNIKDKSYKYYGEKGVTVCERWLRYDLFLEDVELVEGFNKEDFYNKKIFLDKDYKSDTDNKIYSLETCKFISNLDNQDKRTEEYNAKHIKIVVFPDGHEEVIKNLAKFCKEHNLHRQNAQGCLNGIQKQTKGYKFYYKK